MRRSIGAQGTLSEGVDLYIPIFSSRNRAATGGSVCRGRSPGTDEADRKGDDNMKVKVRKKSLKTEVKRLKEHQIKADYIRETDISMQVALSTHRMILDHLKQTS